MLVYWLLLLLVTNNKVHALESGFLYQGACGFPGSPKHGFVDYKAGESFAPGKIINYSCEEGYVLFGPDSRECLHNATWSSQLPTCKANIGLGQQTLQSDTLWSYDPKLAVDNNIDTCSFTPRTTDQRWWQVHLGEPTSIESVAISISPGSYQHFTIFVIELLEGNKALYKPCSKFQGQYETVRAVFLCNDGLGHNGQFVYIRDDREEQEYFGLCEVEVFALQNSTECGSPEVPVGALVEKEGEAALYSCKPGFTLSGVDKRLCRTDGRWSSIPPTCKEVECLDPLSPKNGYIEVSNFKGRYQYGSVATYKCNPGFILWGNASRVCSSSGEWDGSTPVCHPITCGQPPQVENGVSDLVNGTTTWRSLAVYKCTEGYTNSVTDEGSGLPVSECGLEGSWSPPPINCYYDPVAAAANNLKKGRSLADWSVESPDGQINIGTLIAIGVLSSLIVLSLIIVIIIVTHRRSQAQVNSRKTSQSSSDHLIMDNNKPNETQGSVLGIVIYDDLNQPHTVDTVPELQEPAIPNLKEKEVVSHANIMDRYDVTNTLYHHTTLSTFSARKLSPSRDQETRKSPVSSRSSGDGGSDKDGHYSALSGKGEYQREQNGDIEVDSPYSTVQSLRRAEDPYSRLRRTDGSTNRPDGYMHRSDGSEDEEEDPYARVKPREGEEESNYETLETDQNYEIISLSRRYKDGTNKDKDTSVSSGTSSASQATIRMAGSDQDVQALYARVDMTKKQRNRNSDSSISPSSPEPLLPTPFNNILSRPASIQLPGRRGSREKTAPNRSSGRVTDSSDVSPTKQLINKWNNISETPDNVNVVLNPLAAMSRSRADDSHQAAMSRTRSVERLAEQSPSYSRPSPGSRTLGRPSKGNLAQGSPRDQRMAQGSPSTQRMAQGSPRMASDANIPKPLPRTIHSFQKTQGFFEETSLKPSRVQKLVSGIGKDPYLRADENDTFNTERDLMTSGTSILKRHCDRSGWQTANI